MNNRRLNLYVVWVGLLLAALACNLGVSSRPGQPPPPGPMPTAPPIGLPPAPTPLPSGDNAGEYLLRYFHTSHPIAIDLPGDWEISEPRNSPEAARFVLPNGLEGALFFDPSGGGTAQAAQNFAIGTFTPLASAQTDRQAAFTFSDGNRGWFASGPIGGEYWAAATRSDSTGNATFVLWGADPNVHLTVQEVGLGLHGVSPNEAAFDRNNTLVMAGSEPLYVDPALSLSGGGGLMGDIFSGLVVLGPDMQVRPALASGIRVDESGTVYTFTLKPDARFHNGRPIRAEDVAFSIQRAADPATNSTTALLYLNDIVGLAEFNRGERDDIPGVVVVDDLTLQITIDAPKPYFLAKLTYPVSWVVDRYQVGRPNWELAPNGSGPFRVRQHVMDVVWNLEANPYFDPPPLLDGVVYLLYRGNVRRQYESNEVDVTGIAPELRERAAESRDPLYGSIYTELAYCTFYVTLNTNLPPFDDPLVRRAFALAVDRSRYVEAITNNRSLVGQGLLPPGIPGYRADYPGLPHDPSEAQALLAQSAYTSNMPTITWTVLSNSGQHSSAAAFLIDTWREVLGVDVQVVGINRDNYYARIDAGEYGHLLSEGWCADYPDPENFLDLLFHSSSRQNRSNYANPEYDALVEAARIEPDVVARLALYAQAEDLLMNDAPVVILSHSGPNYVVWKPYVLGYQPVAIDVPQHQFMYIQR